MFNFPLTTFEKFKEFLKTNSNLQAVYNYYKANNLRLATGEPVIYCFTSLTGKKYVGKADDCLKRLNVYLTLTGGYINLDLKEDIINNGIDFFKFEIHDTFADKKITLDNIFAAENYYTSKHAQNAFMYNKINTKLNLQVPVARKCKSLKNDYKKIDPNNLRGFGDIFGI